METMITAITNNSSSNTTLKEQQQAPPTLPPVSTTATIVKNKKNVKKKRNRKSEMCIFAGCIKRASFNVKPANGSSKKLKPLYCGGHKLANMINTRCLACIHPDCFRYPSYGTPNNSKRKWCDNRKTNGESIFKNADKDYLPTLSTEILQTLQFLTHVKLNELKTTSESILMERNKIPAGLISIDTLVELHKYKEKNGIIIGSGQTGMDKTQNDVPINEVYRIVNDLQQKAINAGLDEEKVFQYVDKKVRERGAQFYEVFLSKDIIFDKYDDVNKNEEDYKVNAIRDDETVNVVKWLEWEYVGGKLKQGNVEELLDRTLWLQEHEGYDVANLDDKVGKELTKARKKKKIKKTDFYVDTINTRSTLDDNHDNVENKKNAKKVSETSNATKIQKAKSNKNITITNSQDTHRVDLDAMYDLNNEVRERQELERQKIRIELLRFREQNGGEKAYKGQLIMYGEKLLENEVLGGTPRLNSHSPEKLKDFTVRRQHGD
eukprot:g11558.t1